jgi:hypothetical protein
MIGEAMKPAQTGISIIGVSRAGDLTTTEVSLVEGKWPEPLAPASVWSGEGRRTRVIDLHRLVSRAEDVAIFESYGLEGDIPTAGGPYALYAWWTPEQLEAARDVDLEWRRRSYDGADHDHCLLTWQTIGSGDVAYSSEAGWISVDAYEQFIRDDVLRLRER